MASRSKALAGRQSKRLWQTLVVAWLTCAAHVPGQIVLSDYDTNHPLQVMAIGDSITDDCSFNGAWRQYFQPLLQTNGFAFTFVGRQTSIGTKTFTETRHEGYCGAVIAPPGVMADSVHGYVGTNVYLLKIVADALATRVPDLVLVEMGANDIGRGRDPFRIATNDMPRLLDLILSNAPDANIIVTKTMVLSNAVLGYATNASNVPIYNAALQAMVNARADAGQRVALADMYSAVDYSTMFNSDHLHPNLTGLKAMAREFLTRIQLWTVRSNAVLATLIRAGSSWRYSDAGQDLGTNWVRNDYDDHSWPEGPARLGYGDVVAATTIGYGPDWKQKNPTTYFRHAFVVPENIAFTNLEFRLARQDGAVVYLNGQELFRANMPSGPITYTNRALKRVSGDPSYIFYPTNVVVPFLPAGTNLVAVELHISSPVIPSLGFDMELLAAGLVVPGPMVSVGMEAGNIVLAWPLMYSASHALHTTTRLDGSVPWVPEPAAVQTVGSQCRVVLAPEPGTRFFRLQRQQP